MEIPLHQGKNKIPEKFADRCRDKSMALLFNYFNQIQYFKEYLESYEGNCIILIGPVCGNTLCKILGKHFQLTFSQIHG